MRLFFHRKRRISFLPEKHFIQSVRYAQHTDRWTLPVNTRAIPKGFRVTDDPAGSAWIEYRPSDVSGPARFLIIWVVLVSMGFIGSTYEFYSRFNSPASFVRHLTSVSWLVWLAVMIIAIIVLGLPVIALSWFLFGKSRFGLSRNGLSIQQQLFFWHRTRFVPRDAMLRFTQVKDGGSRGKIRGDDDDSFPTWGLILNAKQDANVQVRQLLDKSSGLGMVLSELYAELDRMSAKQSVDKSDWPGTVLSRLTTEQDINLLAREPIAKSDWLGMALSERYGLDFVPSRERE